MTMDSALCDSFTFRLPVRIYGKVHNSLPDCAVTLPISSSANSHCMQ